MVLVQYKLDDEIFRDLEDYSRSRMMTKRDIVRNAINTYYIDHIVLPFCERLKAKGYNVVTDYPSGLYEDAEFKLIKDDEEVILFCFKKCRIRRKITDEDFKALMID